MPNSRNTLFRDVASIVWLGGEDRLSFLERMSTNRCADLAPGKGRATVLTADNGRAVDLLACHAGPDGAALVTSALGSAPIVTEQLRRYVMFRDRVTVTDASAQVSLLRLLGPDALDLACAASGIDASGASAGDWLETGLGPASVWLLRHPEPGGLGGVDLVLPAGESTEAMSARLRAAGLALGSASAYTRARIAAGWPAFGHEIAGQSNPLELGLLSLVDFDKGCYIGQEVIARLANYEKVQRRLARLVTDTALEPGAKVQAIDPELRASVRGSGEITSLAPSEDGKAWLAMALVPLALPTGAQVSVSADQGDAIVAQLG